jgi:hypothetical protein
MAIQQIQGGSKKLRTVTIKKSVLGPGGVPLHKGMTVRIPENDAYTLVSGEQAGYLNTEQEARAAAAK